MTTSHSSGSMPAPRANADLQELLARPRETLDIEIKGWLDLSDANQRADLAKAILAVANHGGGFVIIGLDENQEGQFSPGANRPVDLSGLSQDDIQNAIQKYLDPAIQCYVSHVTHPDGHGMFAIVSVPGGHRTPIKAKSGSPDCKLVASRVYIRRPGPKSEEPQTPAEWDQLFERCIRARRDELLDGIRDLLAGTPPRAELVAPSLHEKLKDFMKSAEERWKVRVSTLPADAAPRFPHGFFDAGFAIDGEFPSQTLASLASTIQQSVRNHSGWPPFAYLTREAFKPRAAEGAVEAWFGPTEERELDDAAHSDFWRVSPEGLFYIRRGFNEDGHFKNIEPGKTFDITTATWRIAETIIEIYYISSGLNVNGATLLSRFAWTGLSGRRLVSVGNPHRMFFESRQTIQGEFQIEKSIEIATIPTALPEIVWSILSPLYHIFDFWQLPKRLVEEEIRSLLRNTFS